MSENSYEDTYETQIMDRAVEIITAYLSNPSNRIEFKDIPTAYKSIVDVLKANSPSSPFQAESSGDKTPAVSIKKSVTDDHLICLECGGHFKSLKRHLGQRENLTPEQYRAKWSLPDDYPMVAKNYSQKRSDLALKNKLGDQRKKKPSESS